MDYVTISGVELVTVGMKWPASTGPVTLTLEHLADMVAAANDDPHIRKPRLKIGHLDPRFDEDDVEDHNPFYDGTPVFGHATNLRLANDGAVVLADFIEVPQWLADAMPSAYPSRSCEWVWDIKTPGGKEYSAVLTAVSLLGDEMPAIADLEDLERLLTEGAEIEMSEVSAGDVAKATVAAGAAGVSAAADVDKVIQTFWSDFAVDDRYWWWPRSVWLDQGEIIADDDEGGLLRIPITTNDDQEVAFGDPVPVKQEFVDLASGQAVAASQRDDKPSRVFASRSEVAPVRTRAAEPATTEDEMSIDIDALRSRLGLPEDATEEQINAALSADPRAEGSEEEHPPEGETAEADQPEPVAASEEPTVSIDREVLADLQRQASEGAAARAEQVTERREGILATAVKAGKIAPASKDAWRSKLQSASEATEAEIAALPAGLIPVGPEKGVAATASETAQLDAALGSFNITRKGA